MMKKLLFLFLLISVSGIQAQEISRTKVQGKIHVPKGEDAEGISVYNVSAQKGAITQEDGTFEIAVAENDRIQVFALQYKGFTVVVDKGIVEKKRMNIYLNPSVTHLDEVVVRPSDLSGNIRVDIDKIPTYYNDLNIDLSYASMEFGQGFTIDEQSAIRGNVAEEALGLNHMQYGVNFVSIFGGVANLLFANKKGNKKERIEKEGIESNNLQRRFSRKFIEDNFDIPEDRAFEFLYYAQDKGLDSSLMKPENEIRLMDFLHQRSKEFKNIKE